jgi:dTDP-4-dehydrorhamnose 3,5-epimerase
MFDESLGIDWPIPLSESEISDKDRNHPTLANAIPIKSKKVLITGANGQLGQALQKLFPDAECADRESLDITSPKIFTARRWKDYGLILNAAGYTAVDLAETEGRADAWATNALAVSYLAQVAHDNGITLVHVSSDYVFDGTKDNHTEDELFTPLGVYGQTKAAGDIAAAMTPQHYILRTSWVVGKGNNFVRTMKSLAEKGIKPSVVNDQIGRLTFTDDLAVAIRHLVDTKAPYGTYNLSNDGELASWADIAKVVYKLAGHDPSEVTGVTTAEYYASITGIARRPLKSTLDLTKIKATGFTPRDWQQGLAVYWKELTSED